MLSTATMGFVAEFEDPGKLQVAINKIDRFMKITLEPKRHIHQELEEGGPHYSCRELTFLKV